MKTVIATVGTSLITNYKRREIRDLYKKEYHSIDDYFVTLEKLNGDSYGVEKYSESIEMVKKILKEKWIEGVNKNEEGYVLDKSNCNIEASAEIKSIFKILEKSKKGIKVKLISTDTVLSQLASEVIRDVLPLMNEKIIVDEKIYMVKGLQIYNYKQFEKEGLQNLFKTIKQITEGKSGEEEYVLNVSGGYKAIIPFMTIYGQLYDFPLNYIYEGSHELIEVSKLPVQFDWSFAEKYYPYISDPNLYRNNKDIMNELQSMQLIKFNNINRKYEYTAIGELFVSYVEHEIPVSKNVMGYFLEYKLFEYFLENPYLGDDKMEYKQVNHSVREEWMRGRELDLVLKPIQDSSKFIAIEMKPLLAVAKDFKFEDLQIQMKKQIEMFTNSKRTPEEYQLILYTTGSNVLYGNSRKNLAAIRQMFTEADIKFKAYSVFIEYNIFDLENKRTYKNPYQKFMSNPIKEGEIKKIEI